MRCLADKPSSFGFFFIFPPLRRDLLRNKKIRSNEQLMWRSWYLNCLCVGHLKSRTSLLHTVLSFSSDFRPNHTLVQSRWILPAPSSCGLVSSWALHSQSLSLTESLHLLPAFSANCKKRSINYLPICTQHVNVEGNLPT